jgi:hypothetical protein
MPNAAYGTTSILTNLTLPSACDNQENVSVRWIMTSSLRTSGASSYIVTSGGTSRIGNIYIKGKTIDVVPGYQSVGVSGTSHVVTGLEENKTYYYRIRATDGICVSNASDVKQVTTTATNVKSILNEQDVQVYYNPLNDCFEVKTVPGIPGIAISVSDMSGRKLKQKGLTGSERSISVNHLPAGVYVVSLLVDGQCFTRKCVK